MQRTGLYFSAFILVVVGFFGRAIPASAMASDFCMCNDDLEKITTGNFTTMADEITAANHCAEKVKQDQCTTEGIKALYGEEYDRCTNNFDNQTSCEDAYQTWIKNKEAKLSATANAAKGVKSTKSQFIPDCALQDELTGECRDISIFLILAINISRYVFSIIGGLSLLMFVYGGFTMIISQGSSEKIQQGKNIMVAVVVGLLIAFGGYLLVNFLGQSLGLQDSFRLL
jgi:hypothetical protein